MKKPKDFSAVLKTAGIKADIPSVSVTGLTYDSRMVKPGDAFFAIPGVHADGHAFVETAARSGAKVAIVERDGSFSIPTVKVPSVLAAVSSIADAFFDHPSKKIPVVGITGTNGKTTTTYLVEDILRNNGKSCGVMGTISYRFGIVAEPAPNTTPMAADVQRFLAMLVENKAFAAVMEVSSHALELHRVDHVNYAVGVFTNLTQDHLDFHKDMESYFNAKKKLFSLGASVRPAVNIDDEYGARLAGELKDSLTFSVDHAAQLQAVDVQYDLKGIRFKLKCPSGKIFPISTNLMGPHNVANCLSAAAACLQLGLKESEVASGLNGAHNVPGRLERVEAGQKFVVVVDYAHTHDALAKVISALRDTKPKRILCVFGAGGDRDRTKRPKMGRVVSEMADFGFVTSDNPRSEDPMSIMKEVEAGMTSNKNYELIVDRAEAIERAIHEAKPGDIVLIAGKGHETYQIYGQTKVHFSDQEVALKALKK